MSDPLPTPTPTPPPEAPIGSSAAPAAPAQGQSATLPCPVPKKPGHLPRFKVLLHNDDINDMDFVIETLIELTTLSEQDAVKITFEADAQGVALVLVTHKERAELFTEQFASKGLIATMEPDA